MKRASTARDTSESPARQAYAVTPHATNEIGTYEPKAIYVGTGGNITCRLVGDSADVVFTNVPDGALLPIIPQYIRVTGTTASDIVALF